MALAEQTLEKWLTFLMAKAISESLTLNLADDFGGNVIHLNSTIPWHLNLSMANNLPEKIQIVGQPGDASPAKFHFQIKFINNQCFFVDTPPTVVTPDWSMAFAGQGFITDLYLLSNKTITLNPFSSEGSTSTIQLRYTDAELKNVQSEVLPVMVTVGQDVMIMMEPDPKPVVESVTVHLTTFTDVSAPTPLIASLVEPRTILNDGTTGPLMLRLVNTSPDPVIFAPPPEPGSPTATAIELTVDLDDTAAYALCKPSEVDSIFVTAPPNWTEDPDTLSGPKQKTWLFRPNYDHTKQFDPNSALAFSVNGVKSTLPPGLTNLYVVFRDFPIYGTQTAVTQIEKSPLIYNKELGAGLVSQGTTGAKQHALVLNGNTGTDLLLVNQIGAGSSAHFKGGAGVTVENNLSVSGKINELTIDKGVITAAGMTSNGQVTVKANLTADTLTSNGTTTTKGFTSNADSTVNAGLTVTKFLKVTENVDAATLNAGSATLTGQLGSKSAKVTDNVEAGSLTVKTGLLTAGAGANITGQLSATGPVSMFGRFEGRNVNTNYGAATDGIVWAYLLGGEPSAGYCLTILDGNLNGNWIAKAIGGVNLGYDKSAMRMAGSLTFPVPKGGVYNVARWDSPRNQTGCEARVYWMPIGTSQTALVAGPEATDKLDETNTAERPMTVLEPAMEKLVQVLQRVLKQSFTEEEAAELVKALKRLV